MAGKKKKEGRKEESTTTVTAVESHWFHVKKHLEVELGPGGEKSRFTVVRLQSYRLNATFTKEWHS